jgi:hypothetical protein
LSAVDLIFVCHRKRYFTDQFPRFKSGFFYGRGTRMAAVRTEDGVYTIRNRFRKVVNFDISEIEAENH